MFDTELQAETLDRHLLASQVRPFGISFLDDALCGIFPNDLILVGARTGLGKTHLATQIAIAAGRQHRRVKFFALEADRFEIQRRLKYQALSRIYFQNFQGQFPWPRYREWLCRGFDADLAKWESDVNLELGRDLADVELIYRGDKFTADTLSAQIRDSDCDLVIVDHLHYFDFDDDNENTGLRRAIKTIRDCAIHHGKPIVLIAHLRKEDRANKCPLPTLEDFHGHSDLVKIATNVLLLAPADVPELQGAWPTYFHIAKSRSAPECKNFVGIMAFDNAKSAYSENYLVAKFVRGETPERIENSSEIPAWLKRAMRNYYRRTNA